MKFLLSCLLTLSVCASEPIIRPDFIPEGGDLLTAKNAMVVCQDTPAGGVALEVLKEGGNAADAGVALAYALAVTQPKAGNLGGGGFALYYNAATKKTHAIDFREMAPQMAKVDLYLNAKGEVDKEKIRFSAKACGVPGTVAGLDYLSKALGIKKHADMIRPAIGLAEAGFAVSRGLENDLEALSTELKKTKYVRELFYPNGQALKKGDRLIQKNLARTLKRLAKYGAEDFYEGEIAKVFCRWHSLNEGVISLDDLKRYKVRDLTPIKGTYRGYEVYSMPPPSSGGVHLIQMLNMLEERKLNELKHNSADAIHYLTETMKLAYADRSVYLGDPDFSDVPVKELTSKEYSNKLNKTISNKTARPSENILPGKLASYESPDTTHFSIADQYGNVLSLTYTINFSFGSRIMIPELGFFLNNEMDDFALRPGVANAYGLIGGKANALEAGKRPLSSMTPTIVFKEGKPFLVTGSPGGSRIITTVLQLIINVIDFKMPLDKATLASRVHHQWLPDRLQVEQGINQDVLSLLIERGHKVGESSALGCTESILIRAGAKTGYADPRRFDGSAQGY